MYEEAECGWIEVLKLNSGSWKEQFRIRFQVTWWFGEVGLRTDLGTLQHASWPDC